MRHLVALLRQMYEDGVTTISTSAMLAVAMRVEQEELRAQEQREREQEERRILYQKVEDHHERIAIMEEVLLMWARDPNNGHMNKALHEYAERMSQSQGEA